MLAVLVAALVIATPAPGPTATPAVLWSSAPATSLWLQTQPLGVSPDGAGRWLVRTRFRDARGKPTSLLNGGDVEFSATSGEVQWQTRLRFGGPSAIVSTYTDDPIRISAVADEELGALRADAGTSPRRWRVAHVVAAALGPHLVQLGWFPRIQRGTVVIRRTGRDGSRVVGLVAAPSSTYRDVTVVPGNRYHYTVVSPGGASRAFDVQVPFEVNAPEVTMSGKGMWLSFSPRERDDDAYTKLDPQAIVAQAVRAGLRFIELRMAYGEYWEVTPQARPTIDALIDLAAAHGIAIVGWTVPRAASFDDLALGVKTAYYTTAHGTRLAGVAVDLERGDEFLGEGARGYAALTDYLRLLRAALGTRYPLIATVEDPSLEHLTRKDYPYDAIAAAATVLQPMAYWGMLAPSATTPAAVRAIFDASYAAAQAEAGRPIPINLGGQTAADGGRSGPPPDEIAASLAEAKALGACGVTFFDWKGTLAPQWEAIESYAW
ncbi:MAG TPA: hypothetical protein VME66_07000 [Candidatus Acidoferrales bacterium]|nr:hypothetical protein [Candidatus Acidoferrales bacterium]